jgi:hypothetical protein
VAVRRQAARSHSGVKESAGKETPAAATVTFVVRRSLPVVAAEPVQTVATPQQITQLEMAATVQHPALAGRQ